MESVIDKNSKETLLSQLCRKLVCDIQHGILKPGKRIPGDRALAKKYDISRGTVIEALSVLEKQSYIERIPSKGSFVADDALNQITAVKIVFPFPEKSLTEADLGHMENWVAASDAYRGLGTKAKELNAEITFMHFEEPGNESALVRQLKKIETYDGAVFIGHQLGALREAMIKRNKPCVLMNYYPKSEMNCPVIMPDRDRAFDELLEHVAVKGYKRIWILTPKITEQEDNSEFKIKKLQNIPPEKGLAVAKNGILRIDENKPTELKNILNPRFFKKGTDVIFFNHTDYAVPFYEFCHEYGLEIGKDVGAFGYASGITFQGLVPPLTYSRINHFSIGETACDALVKRIRTGATISNIVKVPNRFVIGRSI